MAHRAIFPAHFLILGCVSVSLSFEPTNVAAWETDETDEFDWPVVYPQNLYC